MTNSTLRDQKSNLPIKTAFLRFHPPLGMGTIRQARPPPATAAAATDRFNGGGRISLRTRVAGT